MFPLNYSTQSTQPEKGKDLASKETVVLRVGGYGEAKQKNSV